MSSATLRSHPSGGVSLGKAAVVLALLFAGGLLLGQVGLQKAGQAGLAAFKAIAGAHYRLYLARENLNADGESEFAVLMSEGGRQELDRFLGQHNGWSVRDSLVPGWVVVTVPAGFPGALAQLRAEPFARAVLRNRGMWICH